MMYPLVRELAAADAPIWVPVAVTCRVLGFSRQAYYRWQQGPVTWRDCDDAHLTNAAIAVHAQEPGLGYRLIADQLRAAGYQASDNRAARLCSHQSIRAMHSRQRATSRKPGPPVHDDLVGRDLTAGQPDAKWRTDITEHPTDEGTLYLCAVKDCWNSRIVGYAIRPRMTAELATAALRNAIARRSPSGTIVHSDRGSQSRSGSFLTALNDAGMLGSMGRVGACGDNAGMESFFALLQKNVLDRTRWSTRAEFRQAIVVCIERDYHRRRRQRSLAHLTPIEYETLHTAG